MGVLKDVQINSLNQAIPPMIYQYKENAYPEYLVFRIMKGKEQDILPVIEYEWRKIAGDDPFNTFSVTDRFNEMYGSEERFSKIIGIFCLISILLSCFGILAYIAYNIKRKTKEIGIRKVYGARTREVITLFYKEIAIWFVLSSFIAFPLAYYIMSKWLENFAYRTTLSWWIFVLSVISSFGIAIITTILQTWKTARRNPVETLQYE